MNKKASRKPGRPTNAEIAQRADHAAVSNQTAETQLDPVNPRADRKNARDARGREKRVPLGVIRNKLAAPQRAGYVRRWMNDQSNKIPDALKGWWDFVEKGDHYEVRGPFADPEYENIHIGEGADDRNIDIGSRVCQVVGTKEGGAPLIAYLMEIKEEYHKEDKAAKAKQVKEIDDAILRGETGGDQEGRYTPEGGIKYSP